MKMRLRESSTLDIIYHIYTSGVAGQNFNDINTRSFSILQTLELRDSQVAWKQSLSPLPILGLFGRSPKQHSIYFVLFLLHTLRFLPWSPTSLKLPWSNLWYWERICTLTILNLDTFGTAGSIQLPEQQEWCRGGWPPISLEKQQQVTTSDRNVGHSNRGKKHKVGSAVLWGFVCQARWRCWKAPCLWCGGG